MPSKLPIRNLLVLLTIGCLVTPALAQPQSRLRAREAGVVVGVFQTGELNAITDVQGVRVGHTTLIEGDDIRTGVTAIIPTSPGGTTIAGLHEMEKAGFQGIIMDAVEAATNRSRELGILAAKQDKTG